MKNINSPTLLLDQKKCIQNIEMMKAKAESQGLIFRPHFKTHQSVDVGKMFKKAGVDKITVSSIDMAEYFASNGWKDITVAFPVNILEIKRIKKLAKKISLNLLVESIDVLEFLKNKLKQNVGIFIKVDVGYNRTGIPAEDFRAVANLVLAIEKNKYFEFKGLLTHAGHTYKTTNVPEIKRIHFEQLKKITDLKKSLGNQFEECLISVGDTPTCSIMNDFCGADEIRPGNFVFYDIMQAGLGSCNYEQIAVCLAAPVVALHPERNEVVVHGGGVHLSKESVNWKGKTIFGLPVYIDKKGWSNPISNGYVKSLSQEHGIIVLSDTAMAKIKTGDLIGILPVHSCLTVNLMKELHTVDGKIFSVMK